MDQPGAYGWSPEQFDCPVCVVLSNLYLVIDYNYREIQLKYDMQFLAHNYNLGS